MALGVCGRHSEQVAEAVEVFLKNEAESLCVEAVSCKIPVVRLVVYSHGDVAVGHQQVSDVEVANEARCGVGVVPVAELTVYEQPVVEQPSAEQSLVFCVVPSLVARRDICSEVPVGVVDDGTENGVYLLAYLSA